jgi:hypothetical protein
MKRRHLSIGEEQVFWQEVDAIQEKLAVLEKKPPVIINTFVKTLLSTRNESLMVRNEIFTNVA